jgi:16S rRNA (guanine966-N2)-methyltransferase
LRIIGGTLKGRKLATIRGKIIRPTADRLREAIFNILADRVENSVVLDLFAGTGALGIEAFSRGAQSVVFVDNSKSAIAVLKKNISTCAVQENTTIIKWDILKNLNCIKSMNPAFDLVFLDPPYNKDCLKTVLHNLSRNDALEKGACLVIEHSDTEPVPLKIPAFNIADERRYGRTLVSFLRYQTGHNPQATGREPL